MMNLVKSINRNKNKKAQLLLSFFIVFILVSCSQKTETIVISGFTMGTTYSIKIVNAENVKVDVKFLKTKIDEAVICIPCNFFKF